MIITFTYRNNDTALKIETAFKEFFPDTICRVIAGAQDSYCEYCFSSEDHDSSYGFDLNPRSVVQRLHQEPYLLPALLEAARIPYIIPAPELSSRTHYTVLVYEWSCLRIMQMVGSDPRTRRWLNEKNVPRVAEIAKNAVFAAGLDFAEVKIVTGTGGKNRITAVEASPELSPKTVGRLCRLMAHDMKTRAQELQRDLRLGADPEFMVANRVNGKMIPASYLFPHEGLVGCDSLRIPNRQQRPIAEIRPRAAHSPFILGENIRHALQAAQRMAPYHNIKWLAGSEPFAGYYTGGHIHFSPIKINNQLLRALDNYVAVALLMTENPKTARARRRRYGLLGDFREKKHGGFEYRTPSSWLHSEEVCLAALCLAKVVCQHYPELTANVFTLPQAWHDFYECNKNAFVHDIKQRWKELRATSSYQLYKKELEQYLAMIVNDDGAGERNDLKASWRISSGGGIYRSSAYGNRYDRPLRDSLAPLNSRASGAGYASSQRPRASVNRRNGYLGAGNATPQRAARAGARRTDRRRRTGPSSLTPRGSAPQRISR